MTQIETLAELQSVDQRLREKRLAVDEARMRMAAIEGDHRAQSATAGAARESFTTLETQQKSLEERIAALEAKTKDRRMRINRVRNEKELGLLRREVDLAKEESMTLEAELENVYKVIDASRAALVAADDQLATIVAGRSQLAAEIADLEAQTARDVADDERQRAELLAAVDADLRRRYEAIFSRRDGLAVVAMRHGSCRGCHMNIPPQLAIQIQRNESVILCPSCQRILYWRSEVMETSEG